MSASVREMQAVSPPAPDRIVSAERAARALAALNVAEAAFKAAWPTVLAGLDTVPVPAGSDGARVQIFEIESLFAKVASVLRSVPR